MSASEKLKALAADLGGEDADVGIPLPQIVALVEAAEKLRWRLPNREIAEDKVTAALSALDRALSDDYREALWEERDELLEQAREDYRKINRAERALAEAQEIIVLALSGVPWGALNSDGKGGTLEDRARAALRPTSEDSA